MAAGELSLVFCTPCAVPVYRMWYKCALAKVVATVAVDWWTVAAYTVLVLSVQRLLYEGFVLFVGSNLIRSVVHSVKPSTGRTRCGVHINIMSTVSVTSEVTGWRTTCMKNLEMSGILLKIREASGGGGILSGKSGIKLFIVSCIFASIQVLSSTSMIWAKLDMGRSTTTNQRGIVTDFRISRCLESGHPAVSVCATCVCATCCWKQFSCCTGWPKKVKPLLLTSLESAYLFVHFCAGWKKVSH